ncbi:MAG TPA: hypothetical protein DEO94_04350 [Cyanobacteria bacterium UBA11991]|nr:hypothetical protein [Cyanobacteriota bacterium]MDY6364258.1 hypothetical protein [Cyanobacteriota bacterium]MDY6382739.1 hypothetical protein [Cyanobacteriota bacterium]HCB11364.1 hypothetical protein [Cyanobacteria bacterium UBA11991]
MFGKLKKLYDNIKHINKSVDDYNKDSVIQSLPSVAYVNRAKKFIEAKDYDNALNILQSALDISNKDPLVYKYLGKIYEFKHEFLKACEYYEQSALLNATDKEIWLRMGMCYLYSDVLDKAIEAFEKADKVTPLNTDIYTGWGMAFMKQKKYSLAKDKFVIAAQISKYNFTAILLSAVMEMRLEEYTSAEEKLTFLVKVAPNEGSLYEYAHLKLLQNKYDEAEKYALKALDLNKLMLPAYLITGEVYSIQKDYEKTEQNYKTAEDLGLDSDLLYYEWGKSLLRLLNFEQARDKFEKALEKDKNLTEAKAALALLDAYNGIFKNLDELKEKNADNLYIQEAMGVQFMNEHNYELAIEMFKKVTDKDPSASYVNYLLAQCYIYLNRPYKTREYFDMFISQNPKYIKGLIDYAKWLINVSDFEEAQRKLKKAQRLDSDNAEVMNLLFLTHYTLVKKNICEYNIKEAILIGNKALELGKFDYLPQKQELEDILFQKYREKVD